MRIERIAVRGFGALANVEIAWPEGRLLLVVDPNETGKTTLCEAVVAALFGLPHGRVSAARTRERRRPRGGARLALEIDVEAGGRRLTATRDLERTTLRVVDRGNGEDVTAEFTRGAGRDVFGETITGLSEPLFRTTAYVAQNVLDADELSKGLTLELARIADSGGGEASVVRALDALETAASRMPDALSGPTVSVATEITRLGKWAEEKRAELRRMHEARDGVRAAASDMVAKARAAAGRAREAQLLEVATVESERRQVARRLEELRSDERARGALECDAERLAREAGGFTPEILSAIEERVRSRGARPAALARERQELEGAERGDAADAESVARDLGPAASFGTEDRGRLDSLLSELERARAEEAEAEEGVASAWREMEAEGIAKDLRRIEELPDAERAFLAACEEERHGLELEGMRCDRRAGEAQAAAGLVVGERRTLQKRGRGLLATAGLAIVAGAALLVPESTRPLGFGGFALATFLAVSGGLLLARGARHLVGEERRRREEESAARRQAAEARRKLSQLRTRLDRIARGAGYGEGPALARALRRVRTAEPKRAALLARSARSEAARERLASVATNLAPFREALGGGELLPTELVRELRQRLARAQRTFQDLELRRAARDTVRVRLEREEKELAALERELGDLLERAGVPRLLPLREALLLSEGSREKLARRREILEVELPARGPGADEEREELSRRERLLSEERDRGVAALGAEVSELPGFTTPEEARRAAEAARREASAAEEARRRAEKALAARLREGGERAREAAEKLFDAEEGRRRAVSYRDALGEAREALGLAAANAYADFRKGLEEASREVLASWDVPFVGLEFDDRLAVSAVLRDGRRAAPEEIASGFSTGAREQIHLTARLAALRYLGTGVRGVPLLLDDPLVAADDERFVSVMRFLIGNVLEERPVLVVSCHAWRHEQLLSRLAAPERERVASASLRG